MYKQSYKTCFLYYNNIDSHKDLRLFHILFIFAFVGVNSSNLDFMNYTCSVWTVLLLDINRTVYEKGILGTSVNGRLYIPNKYKTHISVERSYYSFRLDKSLAR